MSFFPDCHWHDQPETPADVLRRMMHAHRGQLPSEAAALRPEGCGCPLCNRAIVAIHEEERARRYHGSNNHRIDRAALADVLTRNADPIDTLFDTIPRDLVPLLERLAADGGCYVPSFRAQVERARRDLAAMHAEQVALLDGDRYEPRGPYDDMREDVAG